MSSTSTTRRGRALIESALLLALAVWLGGCLKIAPADGALVCSAVGEKCPSGFSCAANNTCWRIGHSPNDDMSVGDMSVTTDQLPPVDLDPITIACITTGDCPVNTNPCTGVACPAETGICTSIPSPAGFVLPDQTQYTGTCRVATCDGNGAAIASPAPLNTPAPMPGCFTASCGGANGGTPMRSPIAAGTSCVGADGGVCNGTGICGVCTPGATRCDSGNAAYIQTCTSDGQWMDNATSCAPNLCNGGVCIVPCTKDPGLCSGNTPIVCDLSTGTTKLGTPCASSTCNGGVCLGNCVAGTLSCDAALTTITVCNGNGMYVPMTHCSDTPSTPACLNGTCTQCNPALTATTCCGTAGAIGTETCSASGSWGSCTSCGHTGSTCSSGVCACADSDPCGSWACGVATDSCGESYTCGTCSSGYKCSTSHTCIASTTTVTTVKTCPEIFDPAHPELCQ